MPWFTQNLAWATQQVLSNPVFESRSAGLHSVAYYSQEASAAEVNT